MRWLTTLRGQFILVTAAAVIISNFAITILLERGRESEVRDARMLALFERLGAMADLIEDIPPTQRDEVLSTVSRFFVHYALAKAPPSDIKTMTSEENQVAHLLLSTQHSTPPRDVRVHIYQVAQPHQSPHNVIEIAQSLDSGLWLVALIEHPDAPTQLPEMLFVATIGTLLTGAAAAWIAGGVSRPLSALAAAADDIARGRNAPHLDESGPADLKRAAAAFNAMSDRVMHTLDSHRQLLSAVGHDLRTPISAMRITAEFVGDAEVRDRLTRNLEELQSLTEAVLAAARAAPGEEMRRVDLAALIESVCADLVDLGNAVECDIEGSAPCLCRSNEIRRAVRNLVENAVRYGDGARVALKVEPDDLVAVIDDDGPGIPPERLEQVFEPFVRLEASRSSMTGGTGLGLTLARNIAREHGGDVMLENRPGGGLRASLRLPREKTA